jgi:L-fuculose-phosphate aldolase
VITAAGLRKDELLPGDLSIVSLDGTLQLGEKQPSTELALHLAAYRCRPDVRAAVHAHPVAATAFAAAEKIPTWAALAESIATLGPVRLAPFAQPGTSALGDSLEPLISDSDAVLLAHHGALTVGSSLESALQRMELLERLCAVECHAAALGGLVPLPDSYVRTVR